MTVRPPRGLFGSVILVGVLATLLYLPSAGIWPWDHDEVSGLVEVGASQLHVEGAPTGQLARIRSVVPVWYFAQRSVLSFMPANEFGSRFLPVCSAIAALVLTFIAAWRLEGSAAAYSIALVMGLSQPLILIAQNNRFYATGVFFQLLTMSRFWAPAALLWIDLSIVALLTLLAILTHNLLVVFFCLCFGASIVAFVFGQSNRLTLMRTGTAAAVSVLTYAVYLRAATTGWASGGLGNASALVSFASALGVPTLALAIVGGAGLFSPTPSTTRTGFLVALAAGELAFMVSWRLFLESWNAWYAFLLLPPFWMLAAQGVAGIGGALRSWRKAAWYVCVALLLLPKIASYMRDGSRHDLRESAAVVAQAYRDGDTVLANWPAELQYYLATANGAAVTGWWRGAPLPNAPCILVYASNAYEPVVMPTDRHVEVLREIYTRRFDEESYVVRIYRVGPPEAAASPRSSR